MLIRDVIRNREPYSTKGFCHRAGSGGVYGCEKHRRRLRD